MCVSFRKTVSPISKAEKYVLNSFKENSAILVAGREKKDEQIAFFSILRNGPFLFQPVGYRNL